ncbi:MAG TPA: choice-of-anchor D domain-containing protein [Kofleriaceae bacterium]|nr:choice-of-anchor D domain-containing protein [Kofleriaceae bacterium]
MVVRRSRRLVSVGVVLAVAVIASCVALAPELSETTQQSVVVSPGSASFGNVIVGSSSSPMTFTISPAAGSGDSDDLVTSVTGCAGFTINAPGLPAAVFRHCLSGSGGSGSTGTCTSFDVKTYSFTATFNPIVTGSSTCNVAIGLGSGSASVLLSGSGVLPDFVIDVKPKAIDFGDVRVAAASSPSTVNIANAGAKPLTINSVTLNDPQGAFALSSGTTTSHTIAPATSENLGVVCTPPTAATFSGSLVISSNDPQRPSETVSLACRGVTSNLDITPSTFPFISTRVFTQATATISLRNVGNTAGTLSRIELAPGGRPDLTIMAKPPDNTVLNANQQAAVTVKFAPTQATPPDVTALGSLLVTFDTGTPRVVPIAGEALLAKVASEPMQLKLGPVCVGQTTRQSIEVYAELEGELTVTGATTTPPFAVVPGQMLPKLALPKRANEVRFEVSVTPETPGELASEIVVASDAPMQTSYAIPASATALPAGVTALPMQLDFGAIEAHTFTPAQTVTFTNCSTQPIDITNERIDGEAGAEFALTRPFAGAITVQPAETIEIDVQMAPDEVGGKQATLVIEYTGGMALVNLVGTAFLGGDGAAGDSTYYRCSAGGPDGGLPVVGVLGFVVLRRRRRAQA